jgi:hypothetical protein
MPPNTSKAKAGQVATAPEPATSEVLVPPPSVPAEVSYDLGGPDSTVTSVLPVADVAEKVTDVEVAAMVAEDKPVSSLIVCCHRPQGIWRAGRFWSAEQVKVSVDDFSDEQVEQLVAEPLLSVVFVQE